MDGYKSSVLTCNVDEDGCPVCEFLNGKRDEETMLAVINVLDASLAGQEELSRIMSQSNVFNTMSVF